MLDKVSWDLETTGLDRYHGSKPFFASSSDQEGQTRFWQAEVDFRDRSVEWNLDDLVDMAEYLAGKIIVIQNSLFDIPMMGTLLEWVEELWPWDRTEDTLIADHLVQSNARHNLTEQAKFYLEVDIKDAEEAIKKAVKEARTICRRKDFIARFGKWMIAVKDLGCMPSVTGEAWQADMALPRAVAIALGYPEDHPWMTVLETYGTIDSAVTLPVHERQMKIIEKSGLMQIYQERMRVLSVAAKMKQDGITLSKRRLRELEVDYLRASAESEVSCLEIACDRGYALTLPQGSTNDSLHNFIFGSEGLELTPLKYSKKTGKESMDKATVEHLEATLKPGTPAHQFIVSLKKKRSVDTALGYMKGYERFWLPSGPPDDDGSHWWYRLHPTLKPCGTNTLRWSSSSPNEQNISKKENFNLRYIFGPEPGDEWWSCDAQNIELRIPAYDSGEQAMIELFERPTDPPYYGSNHLLVSHVLHKEKFEACIGADGQVDGRLFKKKYESTWYKWVKNGNFAVQYGAMEGSGTADDAYHVKGAQSIIMQQFQNINKLNHRMIAMADRLGYIETMPDRSVCSEHGYPLYCERMWDGRIKPTVPLSYRVQGTACWILMRTMIKVQELLDDINSSYSVLKSLIGHVAAKRLHGRRTYRMIMQIHDELVLAFPKGDRSDRPWLVHKPIIDVIRTLMTECASDVGIPLTSSCTYHPESWSEGTDL